MESLKGKRILVTGGGGCIGSAVVDQLLAEDPKEIIVFDNFIRGSKENLIQALTSGKVVLIEKDMRNFDDVKDAMKGVDYCFHLASLKIIQCVAEPRHALEANVIGMFNVLQACAESNVQKFVFASTASVYGQAEEFPTPETHHPYNNHTLYGATKMAGELMCRSFFYTHGLKYNVVRYFNVYGPRMDSHGKYTEVLIRWYDLIKEGKQPLIYGDGKQSMDFIYVNDTAKVTIEAMKAKVHGEIFNCASGQETTLEGLCLALLGVMKSDVKPEYVAIPEGRQKIEVQRRLADVSRAHETLGFKTTTSLSEGLEKLIEWLGAQKK